MTRIRYALALLLIAPIARADDPLPPGALLRFGHPHFRHGSTIGALLVTPNGRDLITAGGGFVRIWDAATGVPRQSFHGVSMPGPDFLGSSFLALSPDGKLLACGGRDSVRFWELPAGRELKPIPSKFSLDSVSAVSFSPNSRRLLVAQQWPTPHDRPALYWDIISSPPQLVTHVNGCWWAQFTSDGRVFRFRKNRLMALPT